MHHRLEFSEGKSDKFWEVRVEGSALTTHWGRIGTAGQSKTKEFASEPEALAEARAQMAAKEKKGYREVAAAAVAVKASPPPPAPRPPEPERKRERVTTSWHDELRRRSFPWRRDHPPAPVPLELRRSDMALYRKGLGVTTPTLRPALRRALELDPVDTLSAACLLLITRGRGMDLVVERLGVTEALKAQLARAEYAVRGAFSGGYRWVGRATDEGHHWGHPEFTGEERLRRHLAAAPEADYQQALEWATSHRDDRNRLLMTFYFPDAGWAADDVAWCLANLTQRWGVVFLPEYGGWKLLASLDDEELVEKLVLASDYPPPPDYSAALLGNLGPRALRFLVRFKGADYCLPLWDVADPEVATTLLRFLEDRSQRPRIDAYCRRFPEVGIPALARSSRKSETARTLLRQVLAGGSELPPMDEAEQTVCRQLLEQLNQVHDEAALEHLPELFTSPPWTLKQARTEPLVVNVGLPAWEERIEWDEAVPTPYFWTVPPPPGPEDARRAKALRNGFFELSALDHISDAVALELWNELAGTDWSTYHSLDHLLARFGVACLPGFVDRAQRDVVTVMQTLARVDSPRVAVVAARGWPTVRGSKAARAWIHRFPQAAATGLAALAVGPAGPLRSGAEEAVRWMQAQGLSDQLRAAGRKLGAEQALQAVLDFDPLLLFPKKLPKLPDFFEPAVLPRPLLRDGKALPLAAVETLATMLAFSSLEQPYAGLEVVRDLCTAESLEQFVWELFCAWSAAGGQAKEKWAFLAVGHFGGDESARRLAPMVRAWPQQSLFARAELGLDVLASIGTDVALMHIYQMSLKLKSKALQARATAKLEQIAERRGLTPEELADRLVSDLDLDADGSMRLGALRVVFDELLRPGLVDAGGKPVKNLPKSASAEEAARWKALKKDVKNLAATQLARLERALSSGRRWRAEDWRLFLLSHPLLVHLVRRLVWGVYEDGRLAVTFRVAEDSSLADVEDEPFELPEGAEVGLPHPLELENLARWSELFSDYEILQPFPQLGRPVHRLTDEEARADRLARVDGLVVHPGRVVNLTNRGWVRGPAEDGGGILEMRKPLPEGLTAVLPLRDGLWVGAIHESGDQTLDPVEIRRGGTLVPPAQLPEIVLSELLSDLEALR